MHWAAETRHEAATVIEFGNDPQEKNDDGVAVRVAVRPSLAGLLLFAISCTTPALGLQETESDALLDATRFVAVKLMTSGAMVQDALGVGSGAKATDA